jgi:hypothetical protein
VKFRTTKSFDGDFGRLAERERQLFRDALKDFVPACDRYAENPAAKWPASLRVKDVEGAPGIWEMTWSFAGPDGRATFEFVQIDGSLGVQWRRIGRHSVLKKP